MKTVVALISIVLLSFISTAFAKTTRIDAESFSQVTDIVTNTSQHYGAQQTLIVFDIDNTLLTSDVDLGGDIWYQWQAGKLNIKPQASEVVPCLYQDAIGLLYALGTMKPTERQVPSLIVHWQQSGHPVIALTARAPNVRAPTERALNRHGIDFTTSAVGYNGTSAPLYRKMITLEDQTREMSYMKGIMMTSGLNKGEALKYLLNRTGKSYQSIIFVDDSEDNIVTMLNSYQNDKEIDLSAIHYTLVKDSRIKEYGAILTQQQANSMAQQWNSLNIKLDQVFPGRINHGKCLNP